VHKYQKDAKQTAYKINKKVAFGYHPIPDVGRK
jgi:hypothetical protein